MTLFGKIIFGGLGVILCMAIFYGTQMYVNQDQGQVVIQENTTETNPVVTEEATTSVGTNINSTTQGTTSIEVKNQDTNKDTNKATTTKATSTIQVKVSVPIATSSQATSTPR